MAVYNQKRHVNFLVPLYKASSPPPFSHVLFFPSITKPSSVYKELSLDNIMAIPAVLRSQDCLARPYDSQYGSLTSVACQPRRRSGLLPCPNPNPNTNPNRTRRRKRSPQVSPDRSRGQDQGLVAKFPSKNLVMEQVKILKRGEDVTVPPSTGKIDRRVVNGDLVLCSTDRLGPEPETVQKQIRVPEIKGPGGIYAGSAFFTSPPPSSLPLPAFFSKKQNNDAATSDLRRLLRLDLV